MGYATPWVILTEYSRSGGWAYLHGRWQLYDNPANDGLWWGYLPTQYLC
ncbi:MAG: hypothetical protein JHC95_08835 [Solirubrobacteraceae bacterium]|nr:hypothetical protein [Solirubrobacteraceae bacterium]